jgi:hypothetical protein
VVADISIIWSQFVGVEKRKILHDKTVILQSLQKKKFYKKSSLSLKKKLAKNIFLQKNFA